MQSAPEEQGYIPQVNAPDPQRMLQGIRLFLEGLGVPPDAPHLRETPERVAACWQEDLLDGYRYDPAQLLADHFPAQDGGLIVVRDIRFHGICPHHLLPFFGVAHLAYLPKHRIVGFSQLGLLVRCLTHRLTLQELATHQIAHALLEHLDALGSACVMHTTQLCMNLRTAEHAHSSVTTTCFLGSLRDHLPYQQQLLR